MPKAETCLDVCSDLAGPDDRARRDALLAPVTRNSHARLVEEFGVLRRVEYRPPPRPAKPGSGSLKVAVWNAERGTYPDDSATLLRSIGADVNLLSEFDLGMARSGQLHTARELADRLDQGYVFAVEFVELGLGNESEQLRHKDSENADGLHGGAILSAHGLDCPGVIRLEHEGDWFDGERGERRVGGRVAVLARVSLDGRPVTLVSVHLESYGDPTHRAEQMACLLEAVERYAAGGAAIIAGDFNCNSASWEAARYPAMLKALLEEDPNRLVDPVRHEPLFTLAENAGYGWRACNAHGVTTRLTPGEPPDTPMLKIDWIFTRGLVARDPAILPAVNAAGEAISDHEALSVTVSLEEAG